MTKESERRRFERLDLEGAVAVDDAGRELGRVTQVGGGGVGVKLNADRRLDPWTAGDELRITVLESESTARHSIRCRIRYMREGLLGLEFA